VAVTVFWADLTIQVVNDEFGSLVLAYLPGNVDRFLFGVGMLDGTFATADFDIPSAAGVVNYVM
jgi:hypothetical protein